MPDYDQAKFHLTIKRKVSESVIVVSIFVALKTRITPRDRSRSRSHFRCGSHFSNLQHQVD